MAKTTEVTYEVKNTLGTLGENSKYQLRIVSWNGRESKIDVRTWWEKDGNEMAGKGISLTNEEAKTLVDLLTEYLNDEDDDF